MNVLFAVAAVMIAALALFFYRKNRDTVKALDATGFIVDVSISSNPKLVIDKSAKELALIQLGGALRIDFNEVTAVEYERQMAAGEHDDKAYVVLKLARAEPAQVKLKAPSEEQAKGWQAELQALLEQAKTTESKRF